MGSENDFSESNGQAQFGILPSQSHKPTLAYSFIATKDGTLVSAEVTPELKSKQNQGLNELYSAEIRRQFKNLQEDVGNVFPEEDLFVYGNVETLIQLLIEKDVEAWRTLPENLRTFLMRSTEWQYRVNEKTDILNLIINDVEIKWNGAEWVVMAFHSE
jgi:hypothetical protein